MEEEYEYCYLDYDCHILLYGLLVIPLPQKSFFHVTVRVSNRPRHVRYCNAFLRIEPFFGYSILQKGGK